MFLLRNWLRDGLRRWLLYKRWLWYLLYLRLLIFSLILSIFSWFLISLPIPQNNPFHIIINLLLFLNFLKPLLNLTSLLLHTRIFRTPKTQNNTLINITCDFRLLFQYLLTNHTLVYKLLYLFFLPAETFETTSPTI